MNCLLNRDGMELLATKRRGLVLTDCPKHLVGEAIALCEAHELIFINAYSRLWLEKGRFPGEKAVSPFQDIIRAFPNEKTVIDPFMGSGSTGIAAVLEHRDFIGCEINTARFKYAQQRIENAVAGTHPGHI